MWHWGPVGEGFRCVAKPAYVIIEKLRSELSTPACKMRFVT